MNKTLSPAHSHAQLTDYLHLARMLARDKSKESVPAREGRRCSRSPKDLQQDRSGKEEYRALQERYLDLEGKYRDLLEKVRQRGTEHERLKAEIKTYQKNRERDALEIERLRCIIGLVKKQSVSIQVEEDQLDSSFPRGSRLNKFDQSTDDEIKLKNSTEKANPRERASPYKNLGTGKQKEETWEGLGKEGIFSRSRVNLNHTEKDLPASKYSREVRESISSNIKLSNSPYSKLRFVPGSSFK